jgi:membrane-bound metal-dependent hydrolase YbcI (DUF457 family)
MSPLICFIGLMIAHFVGDFICQTHWQASNKSKDNVALSLHVLSYTAVLLVASLIIFTTGTTYTMIGIFVLLNMSLHFTTDYVTSRITAILWTKQDWHNFFLVIGSDQLLHYLALAATMQYVFFT